jgi:peptide-methionine (R)-S-oxide reductase
MQRKEIATTFLVLVLVAATIGVLGWTKRGLVFGQWGTSRFGAAPMTSIATTEESTASPDFGLGTWINSDPLTIKSLRGRVVLIEFWTFGCYNCRNTLPFIKGWHERYGNKGLTIVGVHSPEFDAEKKIENVRREVNSLGIRYPVVTDNEYLTWRAFNVEAWPTIVVLDRNGRVRWSHVGEGSYDQTEQVIQKLLGEQSDASARASTLEKSAMTDKVTKSDEEWRKELSPDQYKVMRQAGTERAFTGAYWDNHEKGVYHCAACGLPLFDSTTKFESGTGWPSFYAPISESNIITERDASLGMVRTEIKCRRCGSHLGHVFEDGPRPTGLRYCMNSVALKLEKQ